MILTTVNDGLHEGPHHLAQMARNVERIAEWQERRQGSGDCPRPSGWGIFCRAASIAAQAVGLTILAAILLFWVIVADALMNQPEPETRCFKNHLSGETHCRTQSDWGDQGEK